MEWFLLHVVSPLLLPVFIIIVLCMIADVRPEPFVKIFVDIVQAILVFLFKLVVQLLQFVIQTVWKIIQWIACFICTSCEIPPPKKKTTPKKDQ